MPDESPKQDAPSSAPLGAETLAGLLENDYFKLKIEEAVRARTQAELDVWWKRLVATVAIIITIVGAFGIKAYWSLEDAAGKADEVSKNLTKRTDEVDSAIRDAKRGVDSFSQTSEAVLKGFDNSQQQTAKFMEMNNQQVANLMRQSHDQISGVMADARANAHDITTRFSGAQADLKVYQSELEKKTRAAEQMLNDAGDRLKDTHDELNMLRATNEDAVKQFRTFQAEEKNERAKLADQVGGVTGKIQAVEDTLLGTGSYVIEEKSPTKIDTGGGLLVVRLKRIDPGELKEVRLEDKDGNAVLVGGRDMFNLLLQNPKRFEANGYVYTISLRYITELWLGSDQAGIQLSWKKKDMPREQITRSVE